VQDPAEEPGTRLDGTFDMAYRGDTTDPLQNIINRQRATRHVLLMVLVMWALPQLFRVDWSGLHSVFTGSQANGASPRTVESRTGTGAQMSAGALEQLLRTAPASTGAPRDVRCLPAANGWDYVCLYQTDVPQPRTQFKIGVRVSANRIVQASSPHPMSIPLVSPQPVTR